MFTGQSNDFPLTFFFFFLSWKSRELVKNLWLVETVLFEQDLAVFLFVSDRILVLQGSQMSFFLTARMGLFLVVFLSSLKEFLKYAFNFDSLRICSCIVCTLSPCRSTLMRLLRGLSQVQAGHFRFLVVKMGVILVASKGHQEDCIRWHTVKSIVHY